MTKHLVAREVRTGAILANRVTVASSRFDRAVGLLGHSHLETGEGLWITPCHGVHTWFMRFSIDVIAMDADGVIVDAVSLLKPWRMRLPKPGAYSVLELRGGALLLSTLEVGDRIRIE